MADGQTATNPQTGERVVLRGGQWVPVGTATAATAARSGVSRGDRNANAGNIKDGPWARSQPGYAGSDGTFARFDSPESGNRAQENLLARNYLGAGFRTPSAIVNRYAPVGPENSQESVNNYINYVSRRAGVDPNGEVTQEQLPAFAAAMREFETGNTQPGVSGPASAAPSISEGQTATNPQTGEKLVYQGGQWSPLAPQEVTINQGTITENGRVYRDGVDMGPEDAYFADQNKAEDEREALRVRREDPVYQAEYARAQGGAQNVPDEIAALLAGQTLGGKGIVPWLTGGVSYVDALLGGRDAGIASQAGRDATRDTMDAYQREHPVANFGLQLLGGLATPGLGASGRYVTGAEDLAQTGRAISGSERFGRAAAVGGATGIGSGALNSSGDAGNRIQQALVSGAVGAGSAGILDAGANRLLAGAQRASTAAPSNTRLLSREGIDLTPGMMAQDIPGIGPILRSLEEGASSIPFAGAPIAGARQQTVEGFNRAAINRALEPLGETLPKNVKAGYDSVEHAQGAVSRAYDRALEGVSFKPTQSFYDDLGVTINQTLADAGVPQSRELSQQISNRVFRNMEFADSPINGQQFKAIESELGTLAANAMESSDGATRALGRSYQRVQDALRVGLREQNPDAAAQLKDANGAYARLMRIEKAAGSTASQANDGVFSPTQLGQAVGQMGSRRASARGDALMQDLAVAGRNVIPSRVGDSGTATRGAITGLAAGAASGVPVAGTLAIPVVATSIAYSRPAQALINTIYRATDKGALQGALGQLARLADTDPALRPYYEAAIRQFLPGQEGAPSPASQATPTQQLSPPSSRATSPALERVLR